MDVKDKVYISLQECLNESEKIPTFSDCRQSTFKQTDCDTLFKSAF